MKEYAHYSNYPKEDWPWPDFSPYELRSKSDNKLAVDKPSMDKLQHLRNLIDKPMKITSGYRSPSHNKKVGGVKDSEHLRAKAYDVDMEGHDPAQFEAAARECGFTGFGFYHKSGFIHIDTGPQREWGLRWFPIAKSYHHQPYAIPDMAQMPEPDDNETVSPAWPIIGTLVASIALFFDQIKDFILGIPQIF